MPPPPSIVAPTYVGGGGAVAGVSGVTDVAEFLSGLLPDTPLDERRANQKFRTLIDWSRLVSEDTSNTLEAIDHHSTLPDFRHGESMAPIEGIGPAQIAAVAANDQGGAGVVAGWLADPVASAQEGNP